MKLTQIKLDMKYSSSETTLSHLVYMHSTFKWVSFALV